MLDDSVRSCAPITAAVREALKGVRDSAVESDLLFLEAWQVSQLSNPGVILRASQIRRANPDLAAAIGAELRTAAQRRAG